MNNSKKKSIRNLRNKKKNTKKNKTIKKMKGGVLSGNIAHFLEHIRNIAGGDENRYNDILYRLYEKDIDETLAKELKKEYGSDYNDPGFWDYIYDGAFLHQDLIDKIKEGNPDDALIHDRNVNNLPGVYHIKDERDDNWRPATPEEVLYEIPNPESEEDELSDLTVEDDQYDDIFHEKGLYDENIRLHNIDDLYDDEESEESEGEGYWQYDDDVGHYENFIPVLDEPEYEGPIVEEVEDEDVDDIEDEDEDEDEDDNNIEETMEEKLKKRGLSEEEITRQLDFIKSKSRIRQYQNVIDILNSNFRKKRDEYGMVERPTESYISAGNRPDKYYYPEYDYYNEKREDFYRKTRRPIQVEKFKQFFNKKIYYNQITGKGRVNNNKFSNYYYGGDLYDGKYDDDIAPSIGKLEAFKHNKESMDKELDIVLKNLDSDGDNDKYSKAPIYSLTRDFYLILKTLTISTKNSTIVGSSVSSSTFYPSDIDILEIISEPTIQKTLQTFVNGIRQIVDKINKTDDVTYNHVKLGIDNRYPNHIGILHNKKIVPDPILISQIESLHNQNLITFDDFEYIKNCKGKGQEYYEKIKKILGEYRKIRWSESDIGNGFKSLLGGKTISIAEACTDIAVINIEVYYILEHSDRLIDVSNFFMLDYKDGKEVIGVNYNGDINDYMINGLKKSIYDLYYSKLNFNPIKMIKRMFSLNKIRNEDNKSTEKIIKILKSELGVIYYVIKTTENLMNFISGEYPEKKYVGYSSIIKGYGRMINQYIHGFSNLGNDKKNIIFKILNTIINKSDAVFYNNVYVSDFEARKEIYDYLEKIKIILDNFLLKSIKKDKDIQEFMPPPSKYLPPKSEQEYHK